MLRSIILGCLLIAGLSAFGSFHFGGGALPATPTCTLSGVSLSGTTFVGGSGSGTSVGTMSATTSGSGCASTVWSVASSGNDHSGTPCNASSGTDFQAVGASLELNATLAPATYSNICYRATVSGATGSPYTQAVTLSGTGITGITLSNSTFPGGTGGTVGTLTVTQVGSTYTSNPVLGTSGGGCPGTNNADFSISGTTLSANASLAAGSYAVCVEAVQAGVGASPTYVPFSITGTSPSTIMARQFNQPSGTTTPATALWMIGQPFKSAAQNGGTAEVPSGDIVSATLGGTSVRVQDCDPGGPLLHADNSTRWMRLLVDYSGVTITPGSSATLQLSPVSGSWSTTTSVSLSSAEALNDTVTAANLTAMDAQALGSINTSGTLTVNNLNSGVIHVGDPVVGNAVPNGTTVASGSGSTWTVTPTPSVAVALTGLWFQAQPSTTSGYTTPSGTWTADFSADGSNSVYETDIVCQGPLGILAKEKAHFVNGSTTHVMLDAVMYYWVTQLANGSAGPIWSEGPYVENVSLFNTQPLGFQYDLTWLRNGVQQRQQLQVPNFVSTIADMPRADGLGDWSADDPQIWVSQDYTKLRSTQTIPPFPTGISYVGGYNYQYASAAISAESAGVFTVGSPSNSSLTFTTDYYGATAIEFNGSLGGLTGISLNTTYWQCPLSTSTMALYDSYQHAMAGFSSAAHLCSAGGTGQIVPTGSYSGGMSAVLDAAPMSTADWNLALADTGSHPDISWMSEAGAGYIVGNTQAWQRFTRVMAEQLFTFPGYIANTVASGCIPSMLPSGSTPSTGSCGGGTSGHSAGTGLGAAKPNSYWLSCTLGSTSCFASDINGSATIPGGAGFVNLSGSGLAHVPGPAAYPVWLLEGDPALQDQLIYYANQGLLASYPGSLPASGPVGASSTLRNLTFTSAAYGTVSYVGNTILNSPPGSVRRNAWNFRETSIGMYVAPQGSAEQTYFRNALSSTNGVPAFYLAYANYKGTNYQNLGIIFNDDGMGSSTIGAGSADNGPYGSNFMQSYMVTATEMAAALDGEFSAALNTMATDNVQWLINGYGASGLVCPYFMTSYNIGWSMSDFGAATPGAYIASMADLGVLAGQGELWSFSGTTTTQNFTLTGSAGNLTPKAGDNVRFFNYDGDGTTSGVNSSSTAGLTDGQDYFVIGSPGTTSYSISTTNGGSAISFSTASNVGGTFIPGSGWIGNCPPGSTEITGASNGDNYLYYQTMGLGIAAARGVSGAAASYSVAQPLGPSGSPCNAIAGWCGAASW